MADPKMQTVMGRWASLAAFVVSLVMGSSEPVTAAFIVCWGVFSAAGQIISAMEKRNA